MENETNVVTLHGEPLPVLERAAPWEHVRPREIAPEDWARYREYVGEIFEAFGMDLDLAGTRDTPERFLRAMLDATSGYEGDPKLLTAFPSESTNAASRHTSQIIEGPISFYCLCEHHALPFHGAAFVGYTAGEHIIGISKLTRLVRLYARRFTVQERMGEQIADTLVGLIAPLGVAVHLEADHLCTQMRGVAEDNSRTVTTFWRGVFEDDPNARLEFLHEVRSRRPD